MNAKRKAKTTAGKPSKRVDFSTVLFETRRAPIGWVSLRLADDSTLDVTRVAMEIDASACWYMCSLGVLVPMRWREWQSDGSRWLRPLMQEAGIAELPRQVVPIVPAWAAYSAGLISRDLYERALHNVEGS